MGNTTIYLDNNASTRVAPEVIEAMAPFFGERYGNPSSMHAFGGLVRKNVDTAREQVAQLIGAKASQIYFTGCGSESDNLAIQGFYNRHGGRTKILATAVEHHAVLNTSKHLRSKGANVFELGVGNNGSSEPRALGFPGIR